MSNMTMKEYVAAAMLTELACSEDIRLAIGKKATTPHEVTRICFVWADVFMEVREELRLAKTKTT
jgi:hypothetical protein